MNVTDEQKEKLKCKIEGEGRKVRSERLIKAYPPQYFLFGGLAGSVPLFLIKIAW